MITDIPPRYVPDALRLLRDQEAHCRTSAYNCGVFAGALLCGAAMLLIRGGAWLDAAMMAGASLGCACIAVGFSLRGKLLRGLLKIWEDFGGGKQEAP